MISHIHFGGANSLPSIRWASGVIASAEEWLQWIDNKSAAVHPCCPLKYSLCSQEREIQCFVPFAQGKIPVFIWSWFIFGKMIAQGRVTSLTFQENVFQESCLLPFLYCLVDISKLGVHRLSPSLLVFPCRYHFDIQIAGWMKGIGVVLRFISGWFFRMRSYGAFRGRI